MKHFLFALFLCITTFNLSASTFQVYYQSLNGLYNIFFGNEPFHWQLNTPIPPGWIIDETGAGYINNPHWYYNLYVNNSSYIDTGRYGYEPTLEDRISTWSSGRWSDLHPQICANTSAFRKMPIRNYQDNQTKFIVNQGVPFNFRAKSHGGLTKELTKSFYFWNFGDGIRRFNKKSHDENASHTYYSLGQFTLSSLVYSTEFHLGISVGGTTNADFTFNQSKIKPIISSSKQLYLESCDFSLVEVVPNNAPVARIIEINRQPGPSTTSITFSAIQSSDPDNNPLTYSWRMDGFSNSPSQMITLNFDTPRSGPSQYSISLTVSDGGKSSSTNHTFIIDPYCFACNGEETIRVP